jgi:VanZ family protein
MLAWLLALLWAGAFTLTHIPAERLRGLHAGDKTLHSVGSGGLALVFWALLAAQRRPPRRRILTVLFVLALYGVFDEVTQPWFGRQASHVDWLFDCLGTIIAVTAMETAAALVRWRAADDGERTSTTDADNTGKA